MSPQSALRNTRIAHLDFDTLTTLASGKLSPGLMYPGPEASSLEPPTPNHSAGNLCCTAGEGDPQGQFVLASGLRRPRFEPLPPVSDAAVSKASTVSTSCLHNMYHVPHILGSSDSFGTLRLCSDYDNCPKCTRKLRDAVEVR